MENGEELLNDGEVASSEEDGDTNLENEVTSSKEDGQKSKNTSNWKQLSEKKKELERELHSEREEKALLLKQLKEVKKWANSLYGEWQKPFEVEEEIAVSEKKEEKLEQKIFLLENKEAKEHLDDVISVRKKYNMDYEDAWKFVKASLPQESVSKKEFSVQSKSPAIPKDLTKVSPEDALSLPKEQRALWRKANGWV